MDGDEKAELQTSKLDRVTAGVAGCGRRATCRLGKMDYGYSWVLNSPVPQDETSSSAPTPGPADDVPAQTTL
ncbi:hypothetical protein EJ065_3877 [Corallococcus coralloides]|uniref:Uncharacterized protein n=1 Tax=Corallococcus coralloides TaxID=184914 RepID=A0A410RU95_CORCK|nr:hypothetical protein EJ065_3877 [Corallococcus coralloides]